MSDFLLTLPAHLRPTIHTFCSDMWDGYLSAIADFIKAYPEVAAKIVVDRFHVAQNYRDDFDTLRKQEMRRLKKELSEERYRQVCHGTLWLLRHNHANLDEEGKERLRTLFRYAPALHQAYTLREELTAILNTQMTPAAGRRRLEKWAAKVERTALTCFDKFLKTLRNHLDLIANYFLNRANSGFVEGLNNKLKTITRRCYGIKVVDSLFRRLWLDLHGYQHFLA